MSSRALVQNGNERVAGLHGQIRRCRDLFHKLYTARSGAKFHQVWIFGIVWRHSKITMVAHHSCKTKHHPSQYKRLSRQYRQHWMGIWKCITVLFTPQNIGMRHHYQTVNWYRLPMNCINTKKVYVTGCTNKTSLFCPLRSCPQPRTIVCFNHQIYPWDNEPTHLCWFIISWVVI